MFNDFWLNKRIWIKKNLAKENEEERKPYRYRYSPVTTLQMISNVEKIRVNRKQLLLISIHSRWLIDVHVQTDNEPILYFLFLKKTNLLKIHIHYPSVVIIKLLRWLSEILFPIPSLLVLTFLPTNHSISCSLFSSKKPLRVVQHQMTYALHFFCLWLSRERT